MITKELINTKVGAACARLGQPIANAYHWQSTGLTEQQILDEIAVMDSEATGNPLEELKRFFRSHSYDEFAFLALKDKRDAGTNSVLDAVHAWQQTQTAKALTGQTNFDVPPYTFTEALMS